MDERDGGSRYETPQVERYGTFRDLTRTWGCKSQYRWWSYGCNDDPKDGGGRS